MPDDLDLSRGDGVLIRGRCSRSARKINVLFWAVNGNNCNVKAALFPADGRWHTAYIP